MRPVPRTDTSDAEFNQFLAELWDSLDAPIPGEWRTFDMTGRASEVPYEPGSYLRPAYERSMLRSAIRGGMTNENLLANLVFFDRHPERNGRLISREKDGSNFPKLSQEWLRIRDTQVRPLLRGTTPGQPALPAFTGSSPGLGGGYGPPGLGQPVAMPRVTDFQFRNADGTMTDPANCCKACPMTLGVGRGRTGSNGMELRFTLEGHRAGMKYNIIRTRQDSLWQRREGTWALLGSSPSGTNDDHHNDDECLSPQEGKFIFVIDTPGWSRLRLPSPGIVLTSRAYPGVTTARDAQDIVFRLSFTEWVIARNRREGIPWTSLALPPLSDGTPRFYVLWHSTVWLTRDSANRLVLDRSRSSIGLGALSEQVLTTAPA